MTVGRIPSVEGGIQPTIVDAKGDLIAAVAADSLNRLAVGSNDQVLVADSAASTGLAWKSYGAQVVAGKNAFINGGMDVWQRGTSISVTASTAPYTADRWQVNLGANQASTVSRQVTGDTTNLPNIQYCMRYQRNSGQTGTGAMYLTQSFESSNSISFAGKTATLSFYARAGANFSPTSSILTSYVYYGTGTDQNITGAYTGAVGLGGQNNTLTTTWQRFTMTVSIASTATEIALLLAHTPTGTASTNDYYEITGVQLEVGSVATPFSRNGATIQGELAACQRYFQREDESQKSVGAGAYYTTTQAWIPYFLKTTMRVAPTVTFDGTGTVTVYDAGSARASTAMATDAISPRVVEIKPTTSSTTAGRGVFARISGSGNFINFDAEL
jgi:hypothetical protein